MDTLQSDFLNISTGLLVCAAGLLAFVISLFRLKSRDFTLLNFGLFGFIFGLRRLVETSTMQTLVGVPFTIPYFHGLLTYVIVIPLSAFLVNIFGRGFYSSMVWVFRSTVVYAIAAVAYHLFRPGPLTDVAIYRPLVIVWAVVWIANVLLTRRQRDIELHILQAVFLTTLIFLVVDQLVSMGFISRQVDLQQPGFAVLFLGLGVVAVHHFFVNERKLHSIEQEIEIARRIQESNLPAGVNFPRGVDIAARYVPMSTVAGDFYDVQTNDETGVGIFIADVSGHGVGAALIGSMLKVGFASQASHIADPALVLTEINRILQGKIKDSFVTACSLYIDFKKGIVRYSIAGHPPPLLWRKSNLEVVRLASAGTILGPFPNFVYGNDEVPVGKGDRLVLYTDGVVETRNKAGEFYGDDRLEALVSGHSDDSPEVFADQIVEQVIKWSGRSGGRSLDDDLTLIVADVLGDSEPLPPSPSPVPVSAS
ncbi:MAG: PP2C family protein-serine/threonine phosphatase [Bacteroidota bacterium]